MTSATQTARSLVLPLALAQFIASYAGTNMNVAISTIASDLGCSVAGIQGTITLFTLTMAALMIPGSKLTDIWGRKRCFILGLTVYGVGALLASTAQGLPLLVISYSLLEGIGSALMIPPIYILITVAFTQVDTRAKYFGVVSGAAGLGAAAGPLIGGLITSGINWRASFVVQFLVVATIVLLARHIVAPPPPPGRTIHFDLLGAVLSAAGLFFVVFGVLQSATYGWTSSRKAVTIGGTEILPKGSVSPVWILLAIGVVLLALCMLHLHSVERAGKEPLFSLRLFRRRTSNLGLITQTAQWLVLQGSFFVISVFLQDARQFNAIETGLTLTPATLGTLAASAAAQRMAQRRPQAILVRGGFVLTALGIALLIALGRAHNSVWAFVPGLLIMGIGIGVMLTASVNVVQSSFPDEQQGEISGVSRSVSNLGSSLGVALAGSILVAKAVPGNTEYIVAMVVLAAVAVLGLVASLFIPTVRPATAQPTTAHTHEEAR